MCIDHKNLFCMDRYIEPRIPFLYIWTKYVIDRERELFSVPISDRQRNQVPLQLNEVQIDIQRVKRKTRLQYEYENPYPKGNIARCKKQVSESGYISCEEQYTIILTLVFFIKYLTRLRTNLIEVTAETNTDTID